MEAHYGQLPGSMITDDTDTLVPFVPRLAVDSSEASPASRDSPLDDGCGWVGSPGEICPICEPNPATGDGGNAVHIREETISYPQDDRATALDADRIAPARPESPHSQRTQANHPQADTEANANLHLVLADRRVPGVQMLFDLGMNPRPISIRRPMTKAERMERRRKLGLACEVCRRRKIRCDCVSKGGRRAVMWPRPRFLDLGKWLSICVEYFVVNPAGRTVASYRVPFVPSPPSPDGVLSNFLIQLRQMASWLFTSRTLKQRIHKPGGATPRQVENASEPLVYFLEEPDTNYPWFWMLDITRIELDRAAVFVCNFLGLLANTATPKVRCVRCYQVIPDENIFTLLWVCKDCTSCHQLCHNGERVYNVLSKLCPSFSRGRGSWWTTLRFESPLPGPVGS